MGKKKVGECAVMSFHDAGTVRMLNYYYYFSLCLLLESGMYLLLSVFKSVRVRRW